MMAGMRGVIRAFGALCAGAGVALAAGGCTTGRSGASRLGDMGVMRGVVKLPTGITMAYVEIGDRSGEAVLFLHGYTDTSASFYSTMRRLAELRPELRLIAVDQRGHGKSGMPRGEECARAPWECFGVEDFAADAVAFMGIRGIARAHVVGHSMGSLVAQELALTAPERVGRVVLIGTAARLKGHGAVREFLWDGLVAGPWKAELERKGHEFPEGVYELTARDADENAEAWLLENWVVEPSASRKTLREILRETIETPLGTWIGVARALQEFDLTERLRDLKSPTLVIWPVQDEFFGMADQEVLMDALREARARHGTRWWWKEYGKRPLPESGRAEDDIGHNAHWGADEAVALDLAAFLREGGEPTRDLPYLQGGRGGRVEMERGGARVLEE